MRISAADAIEKLIAYGLADDCRACVENFLHRGAMSRRGRMRSEPFRAAAAGALAGDVVHVLDHRAQSGERPRRRSLERRRKIMGDKATAIGLWRHLRGVPHSSLGQVPIQDLAAIPGHHAVM